MSVTATPRRRRPAVLLAAVALVVTAYAGPAGTVAEAAPSPPGVPRPVSLETKVTGRYFSRPPQLDHPSRAAVAPSAPAAPAPTRGVVRGRVIGPDGQPAAAVQVRGLRAEDLRPRFIDETDPVTTTTDAQGRFALPQYTEPYLVSFCALIDKYGCAGDADQARPFLTTYRGPDGTTDSWLPQTRLYAPLPVGRDLGRVQVRPYAELRGTFVDGAFRSLRLLRGNGSVAGEANTDQAGNYRFQVAPGHYRLVADRIEGFQTVDTVIGFRSELLRLRAGSPTTVRVKTKPAAEVSGLVTVDGVPLPEELLTLTDARGRFAGAVATDADGRFRIDSLRPGRYRIANTHVGSQQQPASITVDLNRAAPTRADLELRPGAVVSFAPVYADPEQPVAIELRDAADRSVKLWAGFPEGSLAFSGLAPGHYTLVMRRGQDGGSDQVFASRTFTATGTEEIALGQVRLDRPTVTLRGTLPQDAMVKLANVPADAFRRRFVVEGAESTPLTFGAVAKADATGHYTLTGLVPGRYVAMVSSAVDEEQENHSTYRGNLVVTKHRVTIPDRVSVRRSFTAARGGVLTGRLRYAGSHRAPVTSVGVLVATRRGPFLDILPTVSSVQERPGRFRADRLRAGAVTARLLGSDVAVGGENGVAPETLRNSAADAELGTPYWWDVRPVRARVRAGRVTDVGWVDLRLHR